VLLAAQALALVAAAAFYLYELAAGEGSDATRVVMSALLILVGAAGLAALVRGWLGDGSWPRTPTLVWSVLLLPVGIGLVQGTRTLVGWTVVLVALACGVAAWVAREADSEVVPWSDPTDPGAG
jgi:hypothetical protein